MWKDTQKHLLRAYQMTLQMTKKHFFVLLALYVIVILGQVFLWGCFMPSCQAAGDIIHGKIPFFLVVVAGEFVVLLGLAFAISIFVALKKLASYGLVFALAVGLVFLGAGISFGAIHFVYGSFRDDGLVGGFTSLFALGLIVLVFSGGAKRLISSPMTLDDEKRIAANEFAEKIQQYKDQHGQR